MIVNIILEYLYIVMDTKNFINKHYHIPFGKFRPPPPIALTNFTL